MVANMEEMKIQISELEAFRQKALEEAEVDRI
jgi:hypothetical protein